MAVSYKLSTIVVVCISISCAQSHDGGKGENGSERQRYKQAPNPNIETVLGANDHFSMTDKERVHITHVENAEGEKPHIVKASIVPKDHPIKRNLSYHIANLPCELEITDPDWNLPPAAVLGKNSEAMVCWNHLDGPEVAEQMPHPTHGVDLYCMLIDTENCRILMPKKKISDEYQVEWLRDVSAMTDGGFRVNYYVDDGWLTEPTKKYHGVYAREFNRVSQKFGEAKQTEIACDQWLSY